MISLDYQNQVKTMKISWKIWTFQSYSPLTERLLMGRKESNQTKISFSKEILKSIIQKQILEDKSWKIIKFEDKELLETNNDFV